MAQPPREPMKPPQLPLSKGELTLPHMPPLPEQEVLPIDQDYLPERTILEQEGGRKAIEEAKGRLEREQQGGAELIARNLRKPHLPAPSPQAPAIHRPNPLHGGSN